MAYPAKQSVTLGAFLLCLFLTVRPGISDDPPELVQRGDQAARADRHEEAIRNYEEAIAINPSLRPTLLHKLGRQYLWWDRPTAAAELFLEATQHTPADCDLRLDLGMALSWSDQLKEAVKVYRQAQETCPQRKIDALLGEARTLRWRDRTLEADQLYRIVEHEGNAAQKEDARLGLALNLLARDRNRAARERLHTLAQAKPTDSAVLEGLAVSALRLGAREDSQRVIREGLEKRPADHRLAEFGEYLRRLPRPIQRTTARVFHDGDGTDYWGVQLSLLYELATPSRIELLGGNSSLRTPIAGKTKEITGFWGGVGYEQYFNESWTMRGEVKFLRYAGADYRPWTGEMNALWTPRDDLRVDFAAARILIFDNWAALKNKLHGDFFSGGLDWWFSEQNRMSLAIDSTQWNTDNLRMRYRFSVAHQFQSAPRVTVSWATLFQTYDQGFPFALFSPEQYVETGPTANLSGRFRKYWTYALETRVGTLRESQGDWLPLGFFSATLERELWRNWGIQWGFSFSNSNISSATGFRRTAGSMVLQYRF